MEKTSGIYRIVCKANGRYYYGSAQNINTRWVAHKNMLKRSVHKNPVLQNTWNKHGEDSFRIEVAELVEPEKLLEVEDVYLKEHVGKPNCMNINICAKAPRRGMHSTEETKQKISEANRGEKNHFYGKHHSDETKETLREANIGKVMSPESRKKISEATTGEKHPMYGKHHTPEAMKKIIAANRDKKNKGEDSPTAKYTWDFVRELRNEYAAGGTSYGKLCVKYSIPKSSLSHILKGESWKEQE